MHRSKDIVQNEGSEITDPVLIEPTRSRLLSCMFTFVARDTITGKSVAINTIVPSGQAEQSLFEERSRQADFRKVGNMMQFDPQEVGVLVHYDLTI